jgi:hypothetical protein
MKKKRQIHPPVEDSPCESKHKKELYTVGLPEVNTKMPYVYNRVFTGAGILHESDLNSKKFLAVILGISKGFWLQNLVYHCR